MKELLRSVNNIDETEKHYVKETMIKDLLYDYIYMKCPEKASQQRRIMINISCLLLGGMGMSTDCKCGQEAFCGDKYILKPYCAHGHTTLQNHLKRQ